MAQTPQCQLYKILYTLMSKSLPLFIPALTGNELAGLRLRLRLDVKVCFTEILSSLLCRDCRHNTTIILL